MKNEMVNGSTKSIVKRHGNNMLIGTQLVTNLHQKNSNLDSIDKRD
jgi:hypothetical protein